MPKDFRKHLRTIQAANDEANPDLPEPPPDPPPIRKEPPLVRSEASRGQSRPPPSRNEALRAQPDVIRSHPADESGLGYGLTICRARNAGAVCFALMGVLLMLIMVAGFGADPKQLAQAAESQAGRKLLGFILMPVMLGAGGAIAGLAAACMFAPATYLRSEQARKWRQRIGSDDLVVIRGVCSTLTILSIAAIAGLGYLMYLMVTSSPR